MNDLGSLTLVSKSNQGHDAHCLESLPFTLWIKNTLAVPVMLDRVHLTFKSPYSVPPESVTTTHGCAGKVLSPNILTPIRITIQPSLLFQLDSNVFQVRADGCIQGSDGPKPSVGMTVLSSDYVNVHEAEPFERKQVFVSFKDEEDLALAKVAKSMLQLAGFSPYLARDDHGTGARYWEDKIYPAIRASIATLVIWTPSTAAKPNEVLRELRYSREVGTPVGLFRGDRSELPTEYPSSYLEYEAFDAEAPWIPFAKALEAAARRHGQGLPFFHSPTSEP